MISGLDESFLDTPNKPPVSIASSPSYARIKLIFVIKDKLSHIWSGAQYITLQHNAVEYSTAQHITNLL
jgi:hypothetical protein